MTCPRSPHGVRGPRKRTATGRHTPEKVSAVPASAPRPAVTPPRRCPRSRKRTATGRHTPEKARGQDIYAVTAPLVVEAVRRILADQTRTTGVASAGAMFDAPDFFRSLTPHLAIDLSD